MQLPKGLLIGGGVALFLGVCGGFFAMPKLMNKAVKEQKGLKMGSLTRQMWEKLPFPLNFKVTIFNVTNPQEVTTGGTPFLQEIGPYHYDEYKWKVVDKDRNLDDTVAYRPQVWYYFNASKSGGLTGEEVVTVPNVLLLSIVQTVEKEAPATMTMINKAMKEIFNKPDTAYMTVKVKDLLFDGILINCTVKEFASKAVCSKIEEKVGTSFKKVGDQLYTFSFFGIKNGSEGAVVRVKRGIKNATEVGRVVEYNERQKLDVWGGDHCNNLTGTDGTIFRPFYSEGEDIVSFAPDICRSMTLRFVRTDVHREVPVFRYTGGFGDIAANPQEHCFCTSNTTCPKKGAMELEKCLGSPIVATMPHFYESVLEYQTGVNGLRPEKEKHEIAVEFEPVSGTPLSAASRLQFNIEMHSIPKIDVLKQVKTTMHPIFWVEESIVIPDAIVDVIKNQLLRMISIIDSGKWAMIVFGLLTMGVGRYLQVKAKTGSGDVTTVVPFDQTPQKLDVMKKSAMMRY